MIHTALHYSTLTLSNCVHIKLKLGIHVYIRLVAQCLIVEVLLSISLHMFGSVNVLSLRVDFTHVQLDVSNRNVDG